MEKITEEARRLEQSYSIEELKFLRDFLKSHIEFSEIGVPESFVTKNIREAKEKREKGESPWRK